MEAMMNGKGFEISLDRTRHIVKARIWGVWDTEFAKKYERAFMEQVEEIRASGKEWYAFEDFRGLSSCADEVQRILRQQIVQAKKEGMKKLAYLGKSSVEQKQLSKLFLTSGILLYASAESEEEAMQWLLQD